MSREEIAERELGHTEVSAGIARALVVCFLLSIVSVAAIQYVSSVVGWARGETDSPWPQSHEVVDIPAVGISAIRSSQGPPLVRLLFANRTMLAQIEKFENDFDDSTLVGRWMQPRIQSLLTRWTGVGSEQVYLGDDGWLFFSDSVDHLTGPGFLETAYLVKRAASGSEWVSAPQPDPRLAIIDFHQQLKLRNIELVVMPVPVKASIHPEKLTRSLEASAAPVHNASFSRFLEDLETNGVMVFDPSAALLEAKSTEDSAFLATDTHWRPEAMDHVAQTLAGFISKRITLPEVFSSPLTTEAAQVANRGDLAAMLRLPQDSSLYPMEYVSVQQVVNASDVLWRPNPGADVLLLGDSFANIYSLPFMGWGESSGLAASLSRHLERPIDTITRNDDGAYAPRLTLSQHLARGRDRLDGKKVVIWEFTSRELSFGDWRLTPLELQKQGERLFFTPDPGATTVVRGTIENMGEIPRPASAPYADHIVALHLVDLSSEDQGIEAGEAVVMVWSMRDFQLVSGAHYRIGEDVTLSLRPWSDVANDLGTVTRSELYDDVLLFASPCWGEELEP